MGSGSPCLFCGADIQSGDTIRMVTRYSCRKCWSQDIDKLLADCRAVLEKVADCQECYVCKTLSTDLIARLPERKEGTGGE